MSNTLNGTVKLVMDRQTFDSGFVKHEFVITTKDKYPQDVKFETVRDKVSLCDDLTEGQEVIVHFNCRGNEYKGRYFVNLEAWKIDTDSNQERPQQPKAELPPAPEGNDDMGFPF